MELNLNLNEQFSYQLTPYGHYVFVERMEEFAIHPTHIAQATNFPQEDTSSLGEIIFNFGKHICNNQKPLFINNMFYQKGIPFDFLNSSCHIIFDEDAYSLFKIPKHIKSKTLTFHQFSLIFCDQFYNGNHRKLIKDFSANFYFPHFQLINEKQNSIESYVNPKKFKA